jgi:hypothetical protein
MAEKNKKITDAKDSGSYLGVNYSGLNFTVTDPETNTLAPVWLTPTKSATAGDLGYYFQYLFAQDPQGYNFYANILRNKGYDPTPARIAEIAVGAIDYASDNYGKNYSVVDYFMALPDLTGGAGGGGATTTKVYQETTDISNRGDAEMILNNSYQQNLGRRASNKEIKAFYDALKELQKSNPSIYSGTSTAGGGVSSQVGTSSGGFNAQQFAEEWALSRPEYAETFAATNFMNVLESMVNRGPSLGGNA